MKCSVVILAAGDSRRIGYPKAMLPFGSGDTFVSKIIKTHVGFGCESIYIVVNADLKIHLHKTDLTKNMPGLTVIVNTSLVNDRFSSILLGLNSVSKEEPVFLHDVDRPFITVRVLDKLFHNAIKDGYVSPTFKGATGHPILIAPKVVKKIISTNHPGRNLKEILKSYRQKKAEVDDDGVLVNINSRDDYMKYFKAAVPAFANQPNKNGDE